MVAICCSQEEGGMSAGTNRQRRRHSSVDILDSTLLPPDVRSLEPRRSTSNPGRPRPGSSLDVVVERELIRVRPRADGLDLVLHLVVNPGLDQLFAEDISLQQELVVFFERVK